MNEKNKAFSLFAQLAIILTIFLLGEIINRTIIHVIPGSVLGMVLLLTFLQIKILKVEMVDIVGNFLIKNLAFFFIVPGVSLLLLLPLLSQNWWKIALISIISTFIVMLVTGKVLQLFFNTKND